MTDKILISVIMPSLNVGSYIEESVRSVMGQTLKEIEILCVDAGSTDGTLEIISKLAQEDQRVRLIISEKKSYGYQVNKGIDQAKGEYIAVVETDDYIDPEMYQTLYKCAVEYGTDIVKSNYYFYWTQKNGECFFLTRKLFMDNGMYDKVICPRRNKDIATEDWYLWNGIYRKGFLEKAKIRLSETPGAAFQDIGFLHKTNTKAETAYYIRDCFYRYCIDREGSSSNSGRSLHYSYDEFNSLVNQMFEDPFAEAALYGRMMKSFLCCCEDISDEDIQKEQFCQNYRWFVGCLKKAIADGILDESKIYSGLRNKLEVMLVEPEKAYQFLRQREMERETFIKNSGVEKIIVFGCGKYGYKAYKWATKKHFRLLGFMDNNSALWGNHINDLPIFPPQAVNEIGRDVLYIIANEAHSRDIYQQLISLGVNSDNMCIFG